MNKYQPLYCQNRDDQVFPVNNYEGIGKEWRGKDMKAEGDWLGEEKNQREAGKSKRSQ